MKLTKKSVTQEVETKELICEITHDEFVDLCARAASKTIVEFIGENPNLDDIMAGVQLTQVFANLVAKLDNAMFHTDNDENPDNNEKEEN